MSTSVSQLASPQGLRPHAQRKGGQERRPTVMRSGQRYALRRELTTFDGMRRATDTLDAVSSSTATLGNARALRSRAAVGKKGMRRVTQMMFERFTEKAIKVVMLAQEEARRLGHNFVGTEQILLGLIGESTGIAAKVLKGMGVNLKDARVEVEKIIGRGSGFVAVEIPFTPRAKRVLELALDEARQLGEWSIDSWRQVHLLFVPDPLFVSILGASLEHT